MFGSEVTYRQTALDLLLLEPFACNRDHQFRYLSCLLYLPSVAAMTLCRSVLKEDNILCVLYVDTHSNVSDNSDNEILDSDSDVPTASSRKQLPPSALVVTSDSETSTEEGESNVLGALIIKQLSYGVQLIKNQAMNLSLEPQVCI